MHNASPNPLTHGPVATTLVRFALPVLGGYVLQSLGHSLHAAWIGGTLGPAALAAATQANNLLFVLIAIVFGISQAAGILVAQAMGAGDRERARRVAGTGASLFALGAVVMGAAAWLLAPALLRALRTPPDIAPLAQSYLRWLLPALPVQMLFIFASAVLRGAGDARRPFLCLLGGIALDALLAPALIRGIGPLPPLGMAGSAVALLLSQAAALAALLVWVRRQNHPLWIGGEAREWLRPDVRTAAALLRTGLPMGLQMMAAAASLVALLAVVNRQGALATSAYSAALQLWTYVQMPAMAIGAACTSMAAQCAGAGEWHRIGRVARAGLVWMALATGALIALALLLDAPLLSLFLPQGGPALAAAQAINRQVIGSFLLLGVGMVLSGVVRSTGAVWAPLALWAFALWGIRLPAALWLPTWWGPGALWWSFAASALGFAVLSLAYYRSGHWKRACRLPWLDV